MFDWYVFADYSGSRSIAEQRKRIFLSMKVSGNPIQTESGRTRKELEHEICEMLREAKVAEKRMIFGFDHNYSFPQGFYEALTGMKWTEWRDLLTFIGVGDCGIPPLELDQPRQWASLVNERITENLNAPTDGPFWGPHFDPLKKPTFPFGGKVQERRLVEEHCPRMKSIFQLGGAGSVGLQSLLGMKHLDNIVSYCNEQKIPLHVWPFDGWQIPEGSHVLLEMYPTLFNHGARTDAKDAESCVVWLEEEDRKGTLGRWFLPALNERDLKRARLEGWCLGI